MWDLIVSVPDHCLSFYFVMTWLIFMNRIYYVIFIINILEPSMKYTHFYSSVAL